MDLVSRLVKAYPNGGAQAGAGYLGALAAVLCEYPEQVARRCADPVHGVSRETKFLPTVADLVGWCERATAAMRHPIDIEDREIRRRRAAKEAEEEWKRIDAARSARPSIDDLRAKYGPNWGLKSVTDETREAKEKNVALLNEANERGFKKACEIYGVPADSKVSPMLAQIIADQSK